jgi:hypothetical protein
MSQYRNLPQPGEIWRHYKGKDCRILFVAKPSGKTSVNQDMVIYEVVEITKSLNEMTGNMDSITTISNSKYFRSIDNFMEICKDENGRFYRFEQLETSDDLLWSQIADFDALPAGGADRHANECNQSPVPANAI